MIRTLLIDASCVAYYIENLLEKYRQQDNNDVRKGMILYIQERLFFNTAFAVSPIWCLDSKPYWRSRYEPEYKGHRTEVKVNIEPTLDLLVQLGCYTLALPEFEADDLAAAVVRLFSTDGYHHFLLTSDNDWGGMVSSRVTMISPIYEPRVRQPVHMWGWLRGKYAKLPKSKQRQWTMPDAVGFDPTVIWDYKATFGDKADNLLSRCPRGLIDLFNPIVDPLESLELDDAFMAALEMPVQYNEHRAQQFARALPDLPFSPVRIGLDGPGN